MSLAIGQAAPAFKGQATVSGGEFKEISLADYKGKWVVLFFYPLDFTFVCPTEIKGFNAEYGKFKEIGAEVVGASTDSVFSHKAWYEHGLGNIEFPILGDNNLKISYAYNVLDEEKGLAYRGTFIIDPDGILRSYVVNDLPVGRSVGETLRTVQALQSGELTPCEWKPGGETLGKA